MVRVGFDVAHDASDVNQSGSVSCVLHKRRYSASSDIIESAERGESNTGEHSD